MRRVVNTSELKEINFEEIWTSFTEEEKDDFYLGETKGREQVEKEWPDPKTVVNLPEKGSENYA